MSREKQSDSSEDDNTGIDWERLSKILTVLPIVVAYRLHRSVSSVWLWPAALAMTAGLLTAHSRFYPRKSITNEQKPDESTEKISVATLYSVPPKQFHSQFILHENWDHESKARFCRERLGDLLVVEIDAYANDQNDGKNLLLDSTAFEQKLAKYTQRTLIIVTVPSPVGTRDNFGNLGRHAVTVLIDPVRLKIRINEPMCKNMTADGDVVKFPEKLRRILEAKYIGYTVICEHKQLQLRGEKICIFLAYKMGQYYKQGKIEALTREQVLLDWSEDMSLLQVSNRTRNDLKTLLTHLLLHVSKKFAIDYAKHNVKSHFPLNSGWMWDLSQKICPHFDDEDIESVINLLSEFYIYYDAYTNANYINESGEEFVEILYQLMNTHIQKNRPQPVDQQFKAFCNNEAQIQELVRGIKAQFGATLSQIV